MSNDLKWLMCSDVHFPLHDPRLVELWLKVAKAFKPDAVDLLGDIDDADTTGRWATGADITKPIQDAGVNQTKKFLKDIRYYLPDADCHFHDGNHGWTRHEAYLKKNAPTFASFIEPDMLYDYQQAGFNWHRYDEPPVKRFGDMYAHHGDSISKHAGESVRNDCLNWGVSVVRGHSHRMGNYNITYPITGNKIRGFEIGHLCNSSAMDYDRSPNWQEGFAIAHVVNEDGEQKAHMQLIEIHDYTCFVDGVKFTA